MKIVQKSNLPEEVWERVKEQRDELETSQFIYNGVAYDADRISIGRITSAVVLALAADKLGVPYSVKWIAADNSRVLLDGPGMLQLGLALGAHVQAVFDAAADVRDKIATTKTADTLEKIKLVVPKAKPAARKANTDTPK